MNELTQDQAKKYNNQCLGYLGIGELFGGADALKKRPYTYSLNVNKIGSQVYYFSAKEYQ